MTDNKKGLAAANDQAPTFYANFKHHFTEIASFLRAFQDVVIAAIYVGFFLGILVAGLWGR